MSRCMCRRLQCRELLSACAGWRAAPQSHRAITRRPKCSVRAGGGRRRGDFIAPCFHHRPAPGEGLAGHQAKRSGKDRGDREREREQTFSFFFLSPCPRFVPVTVPIAFWHGSISANPHGYWLGACLDPFERVSVPASPSPRSLRALFSFTCSPREVRVLGLFGPLRVVLFTRTPPVHRVPVHLPSSLAQKFLPLENQWGAQVPHDRLPQEGPAGN